jgi:acetate kinase
VTKPDPSIVFDGDGVITGTSASVPILIVHAREDLEIARETRELLDR